MDNSTFSQIVLSGLAVVLGYSIHYGYLHSVIRADIPIVFDIRVFYINFLLLLLGYFGFLHSTRRDDRLHNITVVAVVLLYSTTLYMMYQDVLFLQGKRPDQYTVKIADPDIVVLLQILGWVLLLFTCAQKGNKSLCSILLMMASVLFFIPHCRKLQFPDHPGYALLMIGWIIIATSHSTRDKNNI